MRLTLGQNGSNFGTITTTNFTIQNLNDQVDMPQSIAETIFIDQEDFLWITTYTGSLVRYDGERIRTYTDWARNTTDSLAYISVTYDHHLNEYQFFGKKPTLNEEIFWFASIQNGEINYKKNSKTTGPFHRSHRTRTNLSTLLQNDNIRSILKLSKYSDSLITNNLQCFVMTPNEAYFYNHPEDGPNSVSFFPMNDGYKSGLYTNLASSDLITTYKNSFLVLDPQVGVLEFSKGNLIKTYPYSMFMDSTFRENNAPIQFIGGLNLNPPVIKLKNLLIDVSGETGNLKFNTLLHDIKLDIRNISFTKDRNNIFISSPTQGVFHLKKKKFKNTFSQGSGKYGALYSLAEKDGILFTSIGNRYKTSNFQEINRHNLLSASMISDQKSNIYIESRFNTLKWNEKSNDWDFFSKMNGPWGTGDRMIYAINDSNTVFFSVTGLIASIDNKIRYTFNYSIGSSTFLQFESDTSIWLGTTTGLYRFNTKKKLLKKIKSTNNLVVRDMLFINDSTRLLATYGKGLCILKNEKLLKTPNQKFGVGTLFSHRIIPDEHGTYWVSTNAGLLRYSKKGIERFINETSSFLGYQFFDKSDGFRTNEFNGGAPQCGIELSNGRIVFPSVIGLVHFNPDDISIDETRKTILIEVFADKKTFLKGSTLDKMNNRITFKVSSPNHNSPTNLQIWYRITDENNWQLLPQNGEISFTNLHSGDKLFEARRVFMNGNDIIENFKFNIPKKRHETWWFKLLILLALWGVVYTLTQARISYLKKAANKLQAKIEEQYETLIAQNDQLEEYVEKLEQSEGSLTKQIVLREKLMGLISHDVMGSLSSIRYLSKELDLHNDQLNKSEAQQYHKSLHLATDNVYTTMNKILDWIKTQREELVVHKDEFSLLDLFDEIREYFSVPSMLRNVKLENQMTEDILVSTDRQVLSSILHNLIENEIKHNEDVIIFIDSYTGSEKTIIQIKNTFSELGDTDKINLLLNSQALKDTNTLKMEGGLGLLLIKELMQIIDVTIQYSPYQTNGHQVILELESK
ncbi:MAG: hypothetical protein COA58_04095 [Bacteroidetes bacterium]|nr:MAG: hypothetical protein COA58_04095 [Bacteroidota bacterium]